MTLNELTKSFSAGDLQTARALVAAARQDGWDLARLDAALAGHHDAGGAEIARQAVASRPAAAADRVARKHCESCGIMLTVRPMPPCQARAMGGSYRYLAECRCGWSRPYQKLDEAR